MTLNRDEKHYLLQELAQLKQDHRELDIKIQDMADTVQANQLDISRLKKQKLKLKDAIACLESKLIPDLHA